MATQGLSPSFPSFRWKKILLMSIGTAVGLVLSLSLVIGTVLWYSSRPPETTAWRVVQFDPVSYDGDAIFRDLPMPDITVTGRAKFIAQLGGGKSRQLGYIVDVKLGELDMKRVPEKYKKSRPSMIDGHEITIKALTDSTYKVHVIFSLRDRDGFQLQEIDGKDYFISSGKTTSFQDAIETLISPDVFRRTKQVTGHLTVINCESCDDGRRGQNLLPGPY